jgi:hypothetical protein
VVRKKFGFSIAKIHMLEKKLNVSPPLFTLPKQSMLSPIIRPTTGFSNAAKK